MSQSFSNSVEILARDGHWVVRVSEESGVSEIAFEIEEHARSFAAGQAIRLGGAAPGDASDQAA